MAKMVGRRGSISVYRYTARVTPSEAVTLETVLVDMETGAQCDALAAGETAR